MNKSDPAERWALLRTMLGTDGIVASEALSEMCGMVELMLDPHKHHGHRHPRAPSLYAAHDLGHRSLAYSFV